MNKVLERQIKKIFGNIESVPQSLYVFLEVVSETYDHAEEDRLLIERSLEISSKELGEKASLLEATLNSTADGILVVDKNGKITSFNSRFTKMWGIPGDILAVRDDNKALQFVLSQLKDPESFLKKVKELYSQPDAESSDILEFKDGRTFERYSQPQRVGKEAIGRVWSFRDITERKRIEQKEQKQIEEVKRMNKLMVDRELKMIELKKEVEALKAQRETVA
ncbi:hypothetical protein A2943_02060 [Candidatus Adlerbacteria bacterium RIFCSPLOWO2_01_FULL_51_16]|uniref:PAS domain-containing protein n=1 Tax=Candidatus Adlerbacteria bacterium RIFCSPLOWO2_01_FULL_51_16 TaxID=1797243 RepID=A0A1F4XIX7_9BACT|nr:MAG: hypothetical protein A2943_02060 [Candidatus Adlerbacteria bacterium RIFCSPLOWO2_01_FULL_51_16]